MKRAFASESSASANARQRGALPDEAVESREVRFWIRAGRPIPDGILHRLLRHHVRQVGRVETAIAGGAARKSLECPVAAVPHIQDNVHGRLQRAVGEDASKFIHLFRVRWLGLGSASIAGWCGMHMWSHMRVHM